MSRPISVAYFSRSGRVSAFMLSNSLSCISQNLPCAWAASEASAASGAFLWNGSGLCLKMTRTLPAYSGVSKTCFSVGLTRPQKGHSKSEYSTMVTSAFSAPLRGAPLRPNWSAASNGAPVSAPEPEPSPAEGDLRQAVPTRPALSSAAPSIIFKPNCFIMFERSSKNPCGIVYVACIVGDGARNPTTPAVIPEAAALAVLRGFRNIRPVRKRWRG